MEGGFGRSDGGAGGVRSNNTAGGREGLGVGVTEQDGGVEGREAEGGEGGGGLQEGEGARADAGDPNGVQTVAAAAKVVGKHVSDIVFPG